MACRICPRTGQRICDPEEAEVLCAVCGMCEQGSEDENSR